MMGRGGLPMVGETYAPDPYEAQGELPPAPGANTFVWGAGGARLSPAQIIAKQQIAAQLSKSNFSPVGSVWEGLGRVTDNVRGALQTKRLDKEATAQQAQRNSVAQALLGGAGGNGAINAAILSDDDGLQTLGKLAYDRANPKPANNDTANDFKFFSDQLGAQAGQTYLHNQLDPIITIPLPGGQTYVGPRSGMPSALGGGGQVSSPSGGAPPSTLPPDFDFGGPTQNASGGFR